MRFGVQVRGWERWRDRVVDGQREANFEFRQVVNKGALNVKTDWAGRWAGLGHVPHISRSISYDLTSAGGRHTAEIGPDKTRTQGPLGTILEDANGLARNRATHAGNRAGRREASRFERAAASVAAKAIGG